MDKKNRIIAISGKSGCGNSTVSRLLAEKLGYNLINYTFRNMAVDKGMSFDEILKKAQTDYSFDRELDQKQVALAHQSDCVIGSRLAIWLLPDADLRLYLWAGVDSRAARIQRREGGDLDYIAAFTAERDRHDHGRYLEIYKIDNDDFWGADLIINTERFLPEQIVDLAVEALRQKNVLNAPSKQL